MKAHPSQNELVEHGLENLINSKKPPSTLTINTTFFSLSSQAYIFVIKKIIASLILNKAFLFSSNVEKSCFN